MSDPILSFDAGEINYEECLVTRSDTIPDGMLGLTSMTFPSSDGQVAVRIITSTDPPSVWVNPDLPWDLAAKQFWNAVCRCTGKPALFPESEM